MYSAVFIVVVDSGLFGAFTLAVNRLLVVSVVVNRDGVVRVMGNVVSL